MNKKCYHGPVGWVEVLPREWVDWIEPPHYFGVVEQKATPVCYCSSLLNVGPLLDYLLNHHTIRLLWLMNREKKKKKLKLIIFFGKGINYELLGPGDPSRDKQSGVAKPETDMFDIPP